jgi:sugar phosphate isomerase/epimerase
VIDIGCSMSITRRDALLMAGSAAAATLLASRPGNAVVAASPVTAVRPALALFSRHLNWASMEEAVDVAASAGFGGIAWAVRPGSHVLPENVARDLPRAVDLTQRAGLGTPHIVTSVSDADSPHAEAIIETATGLGIRYYRAETDANNYTVDVAAQLDTLRQRVTRLIRLNERYGATAVFHTHDWVKGGAVWDSWLLLRDFDPERFAINFDTGYGVASTGTGWRAAIRFARRHIRFLSFKDFRWKQQTLNGHTEAVPEVCRPGEGVVPFNEMLSYFQSTGFNGPVEVQFEYPVTVPGQAAPISLMAYNVGKWQLQMPKADYIALLKRDADFYAAQLRETGLTPERGIIARSASLR